MKFNKFNGLILGVMFSVALIGCTKEEKGPYVPIDDNHVERKYYNVVVSTSTEGSTATYVQAFNKSFIENPANEITVKGVGYEVPSDRTALVAASDSGVKLYNLGYGTGTIQNFDVLGNDNYVEISELSFVERVGTTHARWKKMENNRAVIHNVIADDTKIVISDGEYVNHNSEARILAVDLKSFSFGEASILTIPHTDYDKTNKSHIWRIDNPAILDGKLYYGVAKAKYNPATGDNFEGDPEQNGGVWDGAGYPASTLIVDYPSMTNPKVIESGIATGSNYSYRMRGAHAYNGAIYQAILQPAYIARIANGVYDDTYVFKLADALGLESVACQGWYYVANGIGYAVYYDAKIGGSESNKAWGVARIDLVNKTAVRMNIPDLYLKQYQGAVVEGGKLYMSLAPVGQEGNIYIFDPANTTAEGFAKGAKLKTGAGISYIGVF